MLESVRLLDIPSKAQLEPWVHGEDPGWKLVSNEDIFDNEVLRRLGSMPLLVRTYPAGLWIDITKTLQHPGSHGQVFERLRSLSRRGRTNKRTETLAIVADLLGFEPLNKKTDDEVYNIWSKQ